MKSEKILIDDTTLREGEQTPGVVFSREDKIEIARRLDEIGIQRIEAGFPAASKGEMKAVRSIVNEGLSSEIFGFARAIKSDIDAVVDCECDGVMLSFPPSDIHLKYKLRLSREEYLERAEEVVEYAKAHGLYITYSAEDSTRTELNFLLKVFKTVIDSGVDCARIVDTLGVATPWTIQKYVKALREEFSNPIEVHCHNDHGMAVANSLAALEAGASVVSSSLNGLGERAGIAPTEEVIVCLRNFYGIRVFKTEMLFEVCKFIEKITSIHIPPNKPVTGHFIFCHTSGIHQAAVLRNALTYEPYPPEMVGRKRRFVIGKLSGSHAIEAKLREYGINPSKEKLRKITETVKLISETRRSALTDEEILKIYKKVSGEE